MMATLLVPDGTYTANGVTVREYDIVRHNPNGVNMPVKRTKPLKGVTIHNTGVIAVSGTTMAEQYTRATVNGNMNSVRVHFYVDHAEAWQNLSLDWQGWHAADGSGDGNTATIAIECIGSSAGAEDNAARLAAWLLKKYGLGVDALYTHTYWLNVRDGRGASLSKDERCVLAHPYKVCPTYIIPHWAEFVAKVRAYMGTTADASGTSRMYRIYGQVGAYAVEENYKAELEAAKKKYPSVMVSITDGNGVKYKKVK